MKITEEVDLDAGRWWVRRLRVVHTSQPAVRCANPQANAVPGANGQGQTSPPLKTAFSFTSQVIPTGGQVCLPGGWPIITHMNRYRRYARGLWRHGNMRGYTSAGVGVSGLPVRFNTRGEVVLITLRSGSQE